MGTFSLWHWLVLIVVVMLLFGGRGKISSVMSDVAHGIRNFREGLKEPPEQHTLKDANKETSEAREHDEAKSS